MNLLPNLSNPTWDNSISYEVKPILGIGAPLYFDAAVVVSPVANGSYILNGSAPSTIGVDPSLDSAWSPFSGDATNVLGTVLTGLVPAAGTIAATNTILEGFNKTQGNFNAIGTSYLLATPQVAFDMTLGIVAIDFPINGATAMDIVKSDDITVDLGNFYTLPAGHIYIAEVIVRGNTFDANTTTINMRLNLNSVLQPQFGMSNAGNSILVGSQGSLTARIDTTAGAVQFKVEAWITNGLSAKVSGAGVSAGNGFAINIYSIR